MTNLGNLKARLLTSGSCVWKLYLRLRGCSIGKQFSAIGRPGINRKRCSVIQLGDRVTLCSGGIANPVAEGGRCRLATLSRDAHLSLGNNVGVSSSVICCAKRITIGEGTQIGGGCLILDTDFHPRAEDGSWLTDPVAVSKPVSIGKNCFIGARSIILKGVTISDGAVVGAGSVVTKDIPAATTVAGNPAKIITRQSDVCSDA